MTTSPKISVIVPVYKVEQYLPKCIDSILAQTFTDFELLLVDDGSPDGSGAICDEYAAKDSRIRVFHKPNGGVSSARNLGLDNAQGEWIAFVDSDDWVGEEYLTSLFNNTKYQDTDLVIQGLMNCDKNGAICNNIPFSEVLLSSQNLIKLFSEYNVSKFGFPCSKLYKGGIIRQHRIRFNLKISLREDLIFLIDYLCFSNFVTGSSQINYMYVTENSTLSRKIPDYYSAKHMADNFYSSTYSFCEAQQLIWNEIRIFEEYASLYYFRCITSIYRQEKVKNRKYRLAELADLYSNLPFKSISFHRLTKIESVLMKLFLTGWISFFDIIASISFQIKKII